MVDRSMFPMEQCQHCETWISSKEVWAVDEEVFRRMEVGDEFVQVVVLRPGIHNQIWGSIMLTWWGHVFLPVPPTVANFYLPHVVVGVSCVGS